MKKILAIHTGGTISMSASNEGVVRNRVNPIAHHHFTFNGRVHLVNRSACNLSSQSMTPELMLKIQQMIMTARNSGYSGAVVTHGTDTLEETAYFLQLTVPHDFPVTITGAMRSSNEVGADGLRNFKEAIAVASDDRAQRLGTLVVFNDEINSARNVTKTNATNVSTFKSPLTGPAGVISNHRIYFFIDSIPRHVIGQFKQIEDRVYLLKAYAGMGPELLAAVSRLHPNGLVLEGVGAGNMPQVTVPQIKQLIQRRVPVVMVSRCLNGFAEDLYNDPGGCYGLHKDGVMICRGLNGPKARIKLIVGLSAHFNSHQLRNYMKDNR